MMHLIHDVMSENIKRRCCRCAAGTSLEECVLLLVASCYLGRESWIIWWTKRKNKLHKAWSAWCSWCSAASGGQNYRSSKEADCLVCDGIKNANSGILCNPYLQPTALQMENRMKITVMSHSTIFPRLCFIGRRFFVKIPCALHSGWW